MKKASRVDEVSRILRNASYVLAATVVATIIAGCGGSSLSSGGSTTTTTGSSTGTVATSGLTNLQATGYIETSYLSGAGRQDPFPGGSVTALITLGDFVDDQSNTVSAPAGSNVSVEADAYGGPQVIRTPVTFGPSTTPGIPSTNSNSRLFLEYLFSLHSLQSTLQGVNAVTPDNTWIITGGNITADELSLNPLSNQTFNRLIYTSYIRSFPGRFSSITVRLDPNTIGLNYESYPPDVNPPPYNSSNPRGIFELTQFNAINFNDPTNPSFTGVLSDYLSFDISAMSAAAKPTLTSTTGATVTGQRVFFSGDTYAIADASSSGQMFQLTKDISGLNTYVHGTFNTNSSFGSYTLPSGVVSYLPGTYALDQIDPSDSNYLRKILSLEGMFVDYTKMIKTVSPVMSISFPSTQDNNIQDIVLFKRNSAGAIVDFYYGFIDFEARELYLYPVNTIVNAVAGTGSTYHGTFSPNTLYNVYGRVTTDETSIRSGAYTLDTPLTFADGTSVQSVLFTVYRK